MKKMLTLLLAAVMALTTAVSASAASFADTAGKTCETATRVLASLGIVEGKSEGAYEPESFLTRAEMTAIILRTMNMAETAEGRNIFTDVPSSHWAYASIAAAYQLGIINGTSETTFEPDKTVTYEQAVKMVVAALGYTVQAEAAGGYPAGYLSKASQLDLLKGVAMESDMTRGNMAILVYNALDTALFLQTEFGDVAYGESEETLLSYYLKVTKHTGKKLTATPMAQISAPSRRLLNDEVAMDGSIMKAGETNAQDMLGIRSDIYTKLEDGNDIPVILAIVPRANVAVIDIRAQDIDGRSSKQEIIYTDAAGKEQKENIAGVPFLHNGRPEDPSPALLKPAIGTVRLISENGSVELVIAESYTNHVVRSVLLTEDTVSFKEKNNPADPTDAPVEDPKMVIDLSSNSVTTVLTDADGQPLTLSDLAEWDVLSVSASKDGAVRRMYRSKNMVSGTVSEISTDAVTIDGTAYAVTEPLTVGEIKLGQAAAYYLDFTGAITAVDETYDTTGKTYGWLQSAAMTKGVNAKPQLKIFTQDGEWKVFDLAETVQFNEESRSSASLLEAASKTENTDPWAYEVAPALVDDEGQTLAQLVLYKANEEGVITEISTAKNKTRIGTEDKDKIGGEFSMDWYQGGGKATHSGGSEKLPTGGGARKTRGFDGSKTGDWKDITYQDDQYLAYSGGMVFSRVYLTANTKYFIIPANPANDKEYFIRPVSTISLDYYRYSMECVSYYDVSEEYACGAMVMRNDLSAAGGGAAYPSYTVPAALITNITTTVNEDGELLKSVKMINENGQEVAATAEESFECLYKAANADLTEDEAYYVYTDGAEKTQKAYPAKTQGSTLWQASSTARAALYINVCDLEPGDVIQYQVDDTTGRLTLASVVHRANFSGNIELAQDSGTIMATTVDINYRGGNLELCGTVERILENGLLVSVNLSGTLGVDTEADAIRSIPLGGKFYVWDGRKGTATAITAADVSEGDKIFSHWKTTSQKMVIVYRNMDKAEKE